MEEFSVLGKKIPRQVSAFIPAISVNWVMRHDPGFCRGAQLLTLKVVDIAKQSCRIYSEVNPVLFFNCSGSMATMLQKYICEGKCDQWQVKKGSNAGNRFCHHSVEVITVHMLICTFYLYDQGGWVGIL